MIISFAIVFFFFLLGYHLGENVAGRRWSLTMHQTVEQVKATYEAEQRYSGSLESLLAKPKNRADKELERLKNTGYAERLKSDMLLSMEEYRQRENALYHGPSERQQWLQAFKEWKQEPLIRNNLRTLKLFKEKVEASGLKVNDWVKEKLKSWKRKP